MKRVIASVILALCLVVGMVSTVSAAHHVPASSCTSGWQTYEDHYSSGDGYTGDHSFVTATRTQEKVFVNILGQTIHCGVFQVIKLVRRNTGVTEGLQTQETYFYDVTAGAQVAYSDDYSDSGFSVTDNNWIWWYGSWTTLPCGHTYRGVANDWESDIIGGDGDFSQAVTPNFTTC